LRKFEKQSLYTYSLPNHYRLLKTQCVSQINRYVTCKCAITFACYRNGALLSAGHRVGMIGVAGPIRTAQRQ